MVVMKPALLVLSVIAAVVAPSAAFADRIKVAIVPGIAVNLDAARVDALSQELADALSSELDVEVSGGLEVRRRLPEDALPPDCVANPQCSTDVATRLGVSQLLFVVMVDTGSGGSIQIDSTWVEPATGKRTTRPAIDLASLSDARARFTASAKMLLPDAPVRTTAGTAVSPASSMTPAVPRHLTTPAKITAAVGVVGLGVGIGFGLRAGSKYGECEDAPAACSQSDRDGIDNLNLVADIGYGVAIGAAIATAVLFATSGKEAALVLEPAPGSMSVSAVGRF